MEAIRPLGRTHFGDPANSGNIPSEAEASELMEAWVTGEKLRLHMRQVAAVMKAWALEKEKLDSEEARKWWIAGILHDADWEKFPGQHCGVIINELEKRQVDPAIIRCIASHGPRHFGVEPESRMDHMIYAMDELSGFIHAAALVRPDGYRGMDVRSVMKKLKTPAFAAQISREDIRDASERCAVPLEQLIAFIITHQQEVK